MNCTSSPSFDKIFPQLAHHCINDGGFTLGKGADPYSAAVCCNEGGAVGAHAPTPHVSRLRPGHLPTPSPKLSVAPDAGETVSAPSPSTKHQGPCCQ